MTDLLDAHESDLSEDDTNRTPVATLHSNLLPRNASVMYFELLRVIVEDMSSAKVLFDESVDYAKAFPPDAR